MPEVGEIIKGDQIGRTWTHKLLWHACMDCGKERWVRLAKGKPESLRCFPCAQRVKGQNPLAFSRLMAQLNHKKGEANACWKGGRTIARHGYILIALQPDDFFYPMVAAHGYVREHRLVVAKVLGRCLHDWEIVHHKHAKYPAGSIEDKQDNRYPENLQLVSDDRHTQISILERKIARLQKKISVLEAKLAKDKNKTN